MIARARMFFALAALAAVGPGPASGEPFAIVVGIIGEGDSCRPSASREAAAIVEALSRGGFRRDRIIALTRPAAAGSRGPTRANLLKVVEETAGRLRPEDGLVMVLIAPGFRVSRRDVGDVIADDVGGVVRLDEIRAKMGRSRGGFRLLVLDAGRAAPPASMAASLEGVRGPVDPASGSVPVLFSSGPGRRSGGAGADGRSAFSTALVAALNGDADTDRDGAVTVNEALGFVRARSGDTSPMFEGEPGTESMLLTLTGRAGPIVADGHKAVRRGDDRGATTAFSRASQMDRDSVPALLSLARVQARKDPDAARASYLDALRLDPGLAIAHLELGDVLAGLGRDADAEAEYRKARDLGQDRPDPLEHLGRLFLSNANYVGAIRELDRVLDRDPENASALGCRGLAHFCLRHAEDAQSDLDRAVALQPRSPILRVNRGVLAMSRGRLEAASTDLEEAIFWARDLRGPDAQQAYFNRGHVRFLRKQYAMAITDWEKSRLSARPPRWKTSRSRSGSAGPSPRPATWIPRGRRWTGPSR